MFNRSRNFVPYYLTHIILFIALFVVSVMYSLLQGSIKISKYKPLGENSIQVEKLQQKRLYSFIVYAFSCEVITLPMFTHTCARTFCIFAGCEYDFVESNFRYILYTAIYFSFQVIRLLDFRCG
ncbi:hypothetical protein X798_07212 [Onchocerca flexuosa]|uniref:Uncharacterized protein n=1 Tax=Onchocerca flexuosa TaxID=387005 RepID=A0A238BKS9_9BILA|nr:hypothetical protein X798_07212 [Onchocerca flexuosa]